MTVLDENKFYNLRMLACVLTENWQSEQPLEHAEAVQPKPKIHLDKRAKNLYVFQSKC